MGDIPENSMPREAQQVYSELAQYGKPRGPKLHLYVWIWLRSEVPAMAEVGPVYPQRRAWMAPLVNAKF